MPSSDDSKTVDPNLTGEIAERFDVRGMIGVGGTGTVYKAWDNTLQRWVALKVLNLDKMSERNIARLHKEAKTICQLKHSNIVDIYDMFVTEKNQPVLAMEFIDGVPLESMVEENGPMELREAIAISLQICSAISYAHNRGILHRDLTPNNILITTNEKNDRLVKVVDFGVARVEAMHEKTLAGFLTIAGSGQLVGTVTVISPEQARGKVTDARSDIYSLGCLMFRALTGEYPFLGDNFIETAQMQINNPPPTLSEKNQNVSYPKELERIIAKTLQKVPSDRFQTVDEVKTALEELIAMMSDPARIQMRELIEDIDAEAKFKRSENWHIKASLVLIVCVLIGWSGFSFYNEKMKESENGDGESFQFTVQNDQQWLNIKNRLGIRALNQLSANPNVQRVSLRGATFNNSDLEELCKHNLVILDLRNTALTDRGLAIVSQCKSLRSLLLHNCPKLTDKGGRSLASLKNLIIFACSDTALGDETIAAVCTHDLRVLHIANTKITDAVMPAILALPHLNSIRLGGTNISKWFITALFHMKSIGYIGVPDCHVQDDDIPNHPSKNISRVDLSGNNLTEKIFTKLDRLPKLYFVRLENCLTFEVVKRFRDRHHGDKFLVVPVDEFYSDDIDTEGYYEPTLYDSANGNEMDIKTKLIKWDGDKLQKKIENAIDGKTHEGKHTI